MLLLNQFRKQEDAIEDICIAMYGCETWTIGEADKWMDRITNEEILERIGERRTFFFFIMIQEEVAPKRYNLCSLRWTLVS